MEIVTSWVEAGLEQGREEGRQEGRVPTLRETIIDTLEARFGEVPYTLRVHVAAVSDEAELKRWHCQAAITRCLAAFSQVCGL